jgi:hypothetical protein
MKRRTFFASLFVATFLTSGCSPFANGGPGTYEIKEQITSPENKFTAFRWLGMGGGAAGWCHQKVSIMAAGESLPLETEPEKNRIDYVFSTRCSSDIKIVWLNDNLLKISYTLGDDPFPTSMSQASRTEDGRVNIEYEIVKK